MLSQSSFLNTHIFVLEKDEDQRRSAYCFISFLSSKSGDITPAVIWSIFRHFSLHLTWIAAGFPPSHWTAVWWPLHDVTSAFHATSLVCLVTCDLIMESDFVWANTTETDEKRSPSRRLCDWFRLPNLKSYTQNFCVRTLIEMELCPT